MRLLREAKHLFGAEAEKVAHRDLRIGEFGDLLAHKERGFPWAKADAEVGSAALEPGRGCVGGGAVKQSARIRRGEDEARIDAAIGHDFILGVIGGGTVPDALDVRPELPNWKVFNADVQARLLMVWNAGR